ncbi:tripartite tricarboxylate transporter TctB family protein [Paralimibaculum aggregatum]|uniref:Tripartite tricarboxylate transporter TctB family protein n=2 Tax=Paralimibaculum aggregatum TaxID=3036245 RepID=A0ABQ6LTT8_9RHOB|nr:tripartite tricarboxylate transporter TctB family protein [Limibaculum sp. NKW23]
MHKLGGPVLVMFGLSYALYAYLNYRMGSIRSMGPGMFPVMAGGTLMLLGFVITVADFRDGTREIASEQGLLRSAALVLASIIAFAVSFAMLGLLPAIFVSVLLTSLADGRFAPARYLAVSVALSVFAVLVFDVMLGSNLPLFKLPMLS